MSTQKYRNLARAEQEDKELEELENAYRAENSGDKTEPAVKTPDPEEETWKKRYSDLRSFTDKKINDFEKRLRDAELEKAKAESKRDLPRTEEEARAWKEKYPELFNVLRALWREDDQFVVQENSVRLEELERDRQALQVEKALNAIAKAFDEFEDRDDVMALIHDQDFQDWLDRQPAERGDVIGEAIIASIRKHVDAKSATQTIRLYFNDTNKNTTKKTPAGQDAARSVRTPAATAPTESLTPGKRRWSESEIRALKPHEYDKYEDEIDQAVREGRIDFDITGAAR